MILNHYPPVIKQIKDIQQIAKAEDIEFTKLNTSITEVIRNMFVFTADETGVKRFEKLLGITPKTAQSLDDRKIHIISMMNRRKMSLEELTAMLSNYSEGIRLINDMSNFEMIVEINTDAGSLETINSIIDEILPLNIYFEFALQRQTTIKYKLEDLIFMAFEPAAGENEHCNFDNNITAIKKADYTQSVAGFSYVNSYEIIYIYVPKKRLIMALQFRDRVLQWAVYRLLNPLYEKTYIKDSYACIKERGREKAASRLQYWLRQTERKPKQYYYLKLDISKFFYRVDHEVLLNILKRRIKDERLIKLFDKIINSEKRAFGLPLGVDPCEIDPREMLFDKGMPIGNLTSQMFANIYMNELDQYLKHELHLKYVIRYADDCIILHDSKEELWQVLEKVETFLLENLKLNLNNKTVIRPTTCNIDFVGYMINKDEIRLRSATVKRMRSRIKYIVKAYERGEMTLQEVNATMQSYFGLIKHCTNEGLRENIINGFVLHCTDAARAKARESR